MDYVRLEVMLIWKQARLRHYSPESTLHDGASRKRRDVRINDDMQTILCKLWNNGGTNPAKLNVGDKVQLINLSVNNYGNRTSLNSTHKPQVWYVTLQLFQLFDSFLTDKNLAIPKGIQNGRHCTN